MATGAAPPTDQDRRSQGSPLLGVGERDFALGHDESLAEGVRRVLLEQVAHAISLRGNDDLDTSVHELRKAMKRSRATLRLVRGELGDWRYRQENTCLRDTARLWGPTRDAVVLATIGKDLAPELDLARADADHVVQTLQERAALSTRAAAQDRRRHLDTLTALGSFACRVARHTASGEHSIGEGFAAVRPGILRVATRAHKRMGQAGADPTVERLHAWRKDVKYLGYQLQLLAPIWPDLLAALGDRLKELGSALGGDHDLAVLAQTLSEDPDLVPDPSDRERVVKDLEERRRELHRDALRLGPTVLDDPDALVEQLGRAWRQARPA